MNHELHHHRVYGLLSCELPDDAKPADNVTERAFLKPLRRDVSRNRASGIWMLALTDSWTFRIYFRNLPRWQIDGRSACRETELFEFSWSAVLRPRACRAILAGGFTDSKRTYDTSALYVLACRPQQTPYADVIETRSLSFGVRMVDNIEWTLP